MSAKQVIEGKMSERLTDMFGRTVADVRISVTDRCNFRCTYCIPEDHSDWMPKSCILSYEEITRLVQILAGRFGVRTVRLTGGEPLMRRDLHVLIRMLSSVKPEVDIALTTNGFFLTEMASPLADAGLRRINVSVDSLRPERFAEITRRDALPRVLDGIAAAKKAGLEPIKVNVVAVRGRNDDEVLDLVEWGRENGYIVRFIEFMPLDGGRTWDRDQVFGKDEILSIVGEHWPFVPVGVDGSEPAERFAFTDGRGEFGVIGSVTAPFCDNCDRIRITADGMLRTCLFAHTEHPLRDLMRSGADDDEIAEVFRAAVLLKERGHRIGQPDFRPPDRPMISIGG